MNAAAAAALKITNTTVTAEISDCCCLNLAFLARSLINVCFNSRQCFAALRLADRKYGATGLLYSNGRLVVVRASSPDTARLVVRRIARQVQRVHPGKYTKFFVRKFSVRNIVGTFTHPHKLDLRLIYSKAAAMNNCSVQWNQERFPAAVNIRCGSRTALIFYSAKIVLTGVKSMEELEHFHQYLLQNILPAPI